MRTSIKAMLLAATLFGACSAQAASIAIVNLNADPTKGAVNAGNSSPGYAYNPITLTNLAVGRYAVSVVGIAGGGLYDAYTVYAPTPTNNAYTDGYWTVATNGSTQTQLPPTRFNSASDAYAAYSVLQPFYFVISSVGQAVSFYLDDTAYPYFADDSGGVSLGISRVVPEPMSLGLLGIGLVGIAASRRKRRTLVAA